MTRITGLQQVSEQPLVWPEAQQRTSERRKSPFTEKSMARVYAEIVRQLRLWKVTEYVISQAAIYRGEDADPGVAVWFLMPGAANKPDALRVLACDSYKRRNDNGWAIALTLESLRAVERYGAYSLERAAEGMRALPPPGADYTERPDWKKLLGYIEAPGFTDDKQLVLAEHTYRSMMKEAREAGDERKERMLNAAIAAAREELGGKAAE